MKYKNYKEFIKKDDGYQNYLLLSSCLFIIPSLLSLYFGHYIDFVIITMLLITSILRWGYRQNILYQYIDHNYAKLVFFYYILKFTVGNDLYDAYYLNFNKNTEYINAYSVFHLINIVFFFILGLIYHYLFRSHYNVIFHMFVHLYSVFSISLNSFLLPGNHRSPVISI